VRSSRTYARIRSLTTGTFNLVVKDRIAFRQSGAPSVQANPHKCGSDCPRNPTTISVVRNPVNLRIPQHFHAFSTCGRCFRTGGRGAQKLETARNDIAFRFGPQRRRFSRHTPKRKTEKLRKDPFGGPCFEGTLRKLQLPESSPVAGTIENSHSLKT
jgi:hypothetical protein